MSDSSDGLEDACACIRFRIRVAAFFIGVGYRITPRAFWEHLKEDELRRINERYEFDE